MRRLLADKLAFATAVVVVLMAGLFAWSRVG
jgi:hypothetical protein